MATTRLFLLLAGWLLTTAAVAQQLLGERLWTKPPGSPRLYAAELLRLQPDSLRLLADYQTSPTSAYYSIQPTTTALRRVLVSACDTLPVPGGRFQTSNIFRGTLAIVTRRGQVLVGSGRLAYPTTRPVELRLFGRDGRLRWRRQLPVVLSPQSVDGLLEAPDRGFFVGVGSASGDRSYLFRLDSLGNVLWQRVLSRHRVGGPICFFDPVYTRTGTILFHPQAILGGLGGTGVMEINQNGDSLTTRLATDSQENSTFNQFVSGSLQPLHDGGFLVISQVDSADKGVWRPCLTRFDQQLNLVWRTLYRSQAVKGYEFTHPYELADGSLLVSAHNALSGYQEPFWLFHYSASGVLLHRYAFASPAIATLRSGLPANSYGPTFTAPAGLQPLADSTFTLVDNLRLFVGNDQPQALYLAHLQVPGLRRVIDSHYIPAANSPLAVGSAAREEWLAPAYPNPARTGVNVPLLPGMPAGRLLLRDALGRVIRTQSVAAGAVQAHLALSGVPPGIYLVQMELPGRPSRTQRLLIEP